MRFPKVMGARTGNERIFFCGVIKVMNVMLECLELWHKDSLEE